MKITVDNIRTLAQIIAEHSLCDYCPFGYSYNDDLDIGCTENLQGKKIDCRERLIKLAIDEPIDKKEHCN